MTKIAVVGDADSIRGFAAVGLDTYPCSPEKSEVAALLRRLAGENYGIIYITEDVFSAAEGEAERYDDRPTPAIIPIPGVGGGTGAGMRRVRDSVEKAVGSDIVFGED